MNGNKISRELKRLKSVERTVFDVDRRDVLILAWIQACLREWDNIK